MIFFWLLLALALFAAVPLCALALLVFAALLPAPRGPRRNAHSAAPRPTLAILLPAHNEAHGIAATLATILPQLQPQDRLLVVADNCTDDTAAIARAHGVTVLERQHETDRGKGFALAFGMDHLRAGTTPDCVLMMDADCIVHPGAIDALAATAHETRRPVQAVYLMASPADPTVKDQLSAFAFLTKNLVRPRGLHRLGAPVLLTGTGMAFPWSTIADIPLASGNIVEDMQLGIDLVLKGRLPVLCESARITGQLPTAEKSAFTQRKRWEQGHLRTLLTQFPRLLAAAFVRFRVFPLAADLLIPPLALLAMLWFAIGVAILLAMFTFFKNIGPIAWLPSAIHIFSGVLFLVATILAWWRFGRLSIPLLALLSVPVYMLWKIPLYVGFLFRPEKRWVRTARTPQPPVQP